MIINKNYADYFGWKNIPVDSELFDHKMKLTL